MGFRMVVMGINRSTGGLWSNLVGKSEGQRVFDRGIDHYCSKQKRKVMMVRINIKMQSYDLSYAMCV
jgi:hypothetical protein